MGLGAAVRAKLSTPTSRFFNLSYRGLVGSVSLTSIPAGATRRTKSPGGGGTVASGSNSPTRCPR
jgi:hypothetical protein